MNNATKPGPIYSRRVLFLPPLAPLPRPPAPQGWGVLNGSVSVSVECVGSARFFQNPPTLGGRGARQGGQRRQGGFCKRKSRLFQGKSLPDILGVAIKLSLCSCRYLIVGIRLSLFDCLIRFYRTASRLKHGAGMVQLRQHHERCHERRRRPHKRRYRR